MAKRINEREALFIAYYQTSHNATESAIKAGYSQKSATKIGCQLMKRPKIINAIQANESKKIAEISKESFIDKAISIHESLDKCHPNAPRYYDIAGKALGYIGANQQGSVTNNTQINIKLTGAESQAQLWELTRKMLADNA